MAGRWDELTAVLRRLARQDPMPLTRWPDPDARPGAAQPPPFDIGLAAWAAGAAAELDRQFGADVVLTVGSLRYPQRASAGGRPPADGPPAGRPPAGGSPAGRPLAGRPELPLLDPAQLRASLDGALVVRSGHQGRPGLLVANLASVTCEVAVDGGSLVADVVDPASGAVVGGYTGAVRLVRQVFTAAPGQTVRVPLLVATDSFVPGLGYAVPPGDWGVQVTLDPALGRAVRTPVLPFVISP